MKNTTVASIDLGATSGRVIVGVFSPTQGLQLTEVHRFPNTFHSLGEHAYWDVGGIFNEVRKGLQEAKKLFPELASCGVDVWGVDYALVNERGRLVFPVHAYRDTRTESIARSLREEGLAYRYYKWTGLPIINYNTALQLAETIRACPGILQTAHHCLWLPDYFNYLLTGIMVNEFSIASTGMVLDVNGETYHEEILRSMGIPRSWFRGPDKAGRRLGPVRGIDSLATLEAVLVPGHDTSCAFEAIPQTGRSLIVSSGTWLLVGAILEKPLLGPQAEQMGISNERCGNGAYRPLKILLGLWLLEQVIQHFAERPRSDAEWSALIQAAEDQPTPPVLLDTEDRDRLFNPRNMRAAIDEQLRQRNAEPPANLAGYVRLICDSLAHSIAEAGRKFEAITGRSFEAIVIVGGGSKNRLLCQKLAYYSHLPVHSYQLEATSVGNMGYQLAALGAVSHLTEFHQAILSGLSKREYSP